MKRAFISLVAAIAAAYIPIIGAKGPGGVAPLVPITGTCSTEFSRTGWLTNTTGVIGFTVSLEGTCNLSHLGQTALTATQEVYFTPDPAVVSISHHSAYVAANGDVLKSEVTGTGTFLDATTVALLADETYVSGSVGGRFVNVSPGSDSKIAGTALFTSPSGGVGAFTVSGQIGYQK